MSARLAVVCIFCLPFNLITVEISADKVKRASETATYWAPFQRRQSQFHETQSLSKRSRRYAQNDHLYSFADSEDYFDRGAGESDGEDYYEKREWSDVYRQAQHSKHPIKIDHPDLHDIEGIGISGKHRATVTTQENSTVDQVTKKSQEKPEKEEKVRKKSREAQPTTHKTLRTSTVDAFKLF